MMGFYENFSFYIHTFYSCRKTIVDSSEKSSKFQSMTNKLLLEWVVLFCYLAEIIILELDG